MKRMKELEEIREILSVKDEVDTTQAVKNLVNKVKNLETTVALYQEQARLVNQKKFGTSSEKFSGQTELIFNEAESLVSKTEEEPALEQITYIRKKKSSPKNSIALDGLEVERIDYTLTQEERICPECEGVLHDMSTRIRSSLQVVPARYYVLEEHIHSYACRSCEHDREHTPIIEATSPTPLVAGSVASASLVSHLIGEKYVNATPLYRIESALKHRDIKISRQNMSNWIMSAAQEWLMPLYDVLKDDLLCREVLHADETSVQVLHEPNKKATSKSYEWLYRTSSDTERHIVLYEYQPSRSLAHPKAFLKGFSGYLHTDGYEAYRKVPQVAIVGCAAHARRKYAEALQSLPSTEQKESQAALGLVYYDKLFTLEQEFAKLDPLLRHKMRQEKSKPILDELHAWANTNKALPQSALGKAHSYTLSQWSYLITYLEDGRLEFSNNRAERSIKPFVIGRKNWMFSNTVKGAKASSVIYSIVETAKENGLDPEGYIKFLLESVPDTSLSELKTLLPWGSAVPDKIKTSKASTSSIS